MPTDNRQFKALCAARTLEGEKKTTVEVDFQASMFTAGNLHHHLEK